MSTERQEQVELEIAHVLFIDIVGYSKLSLSQQRAAIQELNEIVKATAQYQKGDAALQLIKLATGDGMALVFTASPQAPAQCAVELARALKMRPHLVVRMGVHSGPVNGVVDVAGNANVAGAGINIAQRVMSCGDAGHILLSKHAAEDLVEFERWRPRLHDLGAVDVKHGVRVELVNLHDDEIGNPAVPARMRALQHRRWRLRGALAAAVLIVIAVIAIIVVVRIRNAATLSSGLEKSIAVLPFENLSDDKQNAFFTDGVQDEILTNLAKVADLKVISRTSVMQYKTGVARNLREIGQQLGVAHVVEGSVQRANNKVRVNVQLVDARNDHHEWADNYDRDLADVFAIQSDIAKAIADQLQAKLSPNEKKAIEQSPTADLAAFDLYSRARTILLTTGLSANNEQDERQAVELLNEAVKRDPSFFDAYCELAYAHENLYRASRFDHTPARLAQAEAALQAATQLRPDAGETHLARAQYLYYGQRDYAGALAELDTARQALPNDPRIFELSGYILRRRGQLEEGVRNLQRAIELDPRNFFTLQQLALSYIHLRRFADAIAALNRALTIVPGNIETRVSPGLVEFFWKADTRPLHEAIDSILAQGPGAIAPAANIWFLCALAERDPAAAERALVALGDNPSWEDDAIRLSRSFGEGMLARTLKDEARARVAFAAARLEQERIVQAEPDFGPSLCVLGLIDAALGRKESALEEGRRAIALLPMEKDVNNSSRMIQYFAITAAWADEKDLAIQQLELGLRAPVASAALTYGALKLHPFWDPLRGDPRFEKIVASLAPRP